VYFSGAVSHPNSFLTREFFTVLAVCHSVMPEVITKKNTEAEEARLKKLRHKTKKQKKSLYLRPKNYNKLDDESSGVDSDEGEKNGADETAEEEAEEQNGSEEPVAQGTVRRIAFRDACATLTLSSFERDRIEGGALPGSITRRECAGGGSQVFWILLPHARPQHGHRKHHGRRSRL
jgi:hypothetical protein